MGDIEKRIWTALDVVRRTLDVKIDLYKEIDEDQSFFLVHPDTVTELGTWGENFFENPEEMVDVLEKTRQLVEHASPDLDKEVARGDYTTPKDRLPAVLSFIEQTLNIRLALVEDGAGAALALVTTDKSSAEVKARWDFADQATLYNFLSFVEDVIVTARAQRRQIPAPDDMPC